MSISLGLIDSQSVFIQGGEILGTADIELPTIEMTTQEFQNSALAGKINVSSTSQMEPMETIFNFQQINTEIKWAFNPGQLVSVEVLSAMPVLNYLFPNISLSAQIVVFTGQWRKLDLGTRRAGEINEPSMVLNTWAIAFLDNGLPVMSIDALSPKFPIDINGIPVGLATALKNFI